MIIQHIPKPKRVVSKTATRLVNYITGNEKESPLVVEMARFDRETSKDGSFKHMLNDGIESERVVMWWAENHNFDDLELMIADTNNLLNLSNSKQDKLYHTVISFPPNESPTKFELAEIEQEVVDALGYSEHQRISAVHVDKAHLHIHVAINKVHPETKRVHTPWKNYEKMRVLAEHLEIKHGLTRVDHTTKQERNNETAFTRADDVQRLSGKPSFAFWLRDSFKDELLNEISRGKKATWENLHKIAAKYDVEIKLRGAGLVFIEKNSKIRAKASAVDRSLSKASVEKVIGKFEQYTGTESVTAKNSYTKINTSKSFAKGLYSEYLDNLNILSQMRHKKINRIQELRRNDSDKVWRKFNEQKARASKLSGKARIGAMMAIKLEALKELAVINARFDDTRKEIEKDMQRKSYIDFILEKGMRGDIDALNQIAKMHDQYYMSSGYRANANVKITGINHQIKATEFSGLGKTVIASKQGGVYVKLNDGSVILSTPNALRVRASNKESAQAILRLAEQRFGKKLEFSGHSKHSKELAILHSESLKAERGRNSRGVER